MTAETHRARLNIAGADVKSAGPAALEEQLRKVFDGFSHSVIDGNREEACSWVCRANFGSSVP